MNFNFYLIRNFLYAIVMLGLTTHTTSARERYGVTIPEVELAKVAQERFYQQLKGADSTAKEYIVAIEKPHSFEDQTGTFFLLLALIAIVAIFRQRNPVYFRNLFRAFRNPTLRARQLREPLEQNNITNLTLDFIFSLSLAFYIYFAFRYLYPSLPLQQYNQLLVIGLLVLGILLLYFLRFLMLRFTGWVFGIPDIMGHYAFNISMINKIEGVLLIPFTIILAFGKGTWVQAALFISLLIIVILLANRYIRSRQAFQYFLTYSKLHFFLYLCTSEILPLALLIKLSTAWMIKV